MTPEDIEVSLELVIKRVSLGLREIAGTLEVSGDSVSLGAARVLRSMGKDLEPYIEAVGVYFRKRRTARMSARIRSFKVKFLPPRPLPPKGPYGK